MLLRAQISLTELLQEFLLSTSVHADQMTGLWQSSSRHKLPCYYEIINIEKLMEIRNHDKLVGVKYICPHSPSLHLLNSAVWTVLKLNAEILIHRQFNPIIFS